MADRMMIATWVSARVKIIHPFIKMLTTVLKVPEGPPQASIAGGPIKDDVRL